ncbi:MAG TPA: nucleotide exchange factor GrpE [Candidatus Acidoferrum sp.]|jgi:molecular chaperone GrpE|nr:nucleotide exchange factor GrpE [Candidatus Acidoferrum sp.]
MDDRTPPDTAEPDQPTAQAEIDDLRRQLQDNQDRLLRALAETENVRRRFERTADDRVKYANEALLRDLLPILDNFDRALAAARASGSTGNVIDGVDLIQRELLRVLERAGLSRYSAVGQRFDPARHEAIARVVSGEATPDTVVSETGPGYLLHGRVLRPALVAVATPPDEDAA